MNLYHFISIRAREARDQGDEERASRLEEALEHVQERAR